MKRPGVAPRTLPLVLVLLASCAPGCGGHPVERTLKGRWIGEAVEQVDDELLAAATGWARGTSLEFSRSTITVSIPAEEPRSASYQVERVLKNDLTLAVARPDGGTDRLHLRLDGERALRWFVGGGRAIVMRRE